jgi:hypothetical protein
MPRLRARREERTVSIEVTVQRERIIGDMSPDELRAYRIGLAHAYAEVFGVFTSAFAGEIPCDVSTVRDRVSAQWDDVREMGVA